MKKIKKVSRQEQIKLIMDNFDFEKVHEVMKKLNWKWVKKDNISNYNIPSIIQLKETVFGLLNGLSDEKISASSIGGFHATKEKSNRLELSFRITDFSCVDLNEELEYE